MLVRTWNVFHGNADPPERRAFLEDMVRLSVADDPDLVCLQELPVWSLASLEAWSGRVAVGDLTERPSFGPFPSSAEVGRRLTELNHGLVRSAFTGQANAVLLSDDLEVREHRALVLNPWSFRRREARRVGLGAAARLQWRGNRRVCQVLCVARRGERRLVLANLHATGSADGRLARAELLRAATFLDGFAAPDEPIVLAGDFNLTAQSTALDELASDWNLSGATPTGIDHVLVRGLAAKEPVVWPRERRVLANRILSDHAPVDREVR